MSLSRAGAIAVVLGLAGCGTSPPAEHPPLAQPYGVIPDPLDGTTAVGTHVPTVFLLDRGPRTDQSTAVASLSAVLSLATYPEGDRIAVTLVTVDEKGANGRLGVELHPTVPLTDRWYAIHVGALPDETFAHPYMTYRGAAPDGSYSVRFRIGSDPQLNAIQFCDKEKGFYSGAIAYSEPVLSPAAGPPVVLTYVSGGAPLCDFSLSMAPGETTPTPFLHDSYQFTCSELDSTKTLQIDVGSGMTTKAGATVPPLHQTVEIAKLPVSQPPCSIWTRDF